MGLEPTGNNNALANCCSSPLLAGTMVVLMAITMVGIMVAIMMVAII